MHAMRRSSPALAAAAARSDTPTTPWRRVTPRTHSLTNRRRSSDKPSDAPRPPVRPILRPDRRLRAEIRRPADDADPDHRPVRGRAETRATTRPLSAVFSDYLASGQQNFRARAYYELAQAQYGQEDYGAALATINDLEAEYPGERWAQPEALRGDIMYATGKRVEAIEAWQRAWELGTDSDRAFLRSRIEETGDQLTTAERDQLADTLTQPEVRTILALGTPNELGAPPMAPPPVATNTEQAAAEQESEADTEAGYAALEAEPLPVEDRAAGDALAAGSRVAVLLPLTGPNREAGQQALNGLRQAFAGDSRTLLVRDTGGDPDLAARLADALASDVTVLAIIGPLQDSTAAAVAPVSERLQMPTLLLTTDSGLTGAYVVQAGAGSGSKGAYDAGVLVRDAISQRRALAWRATRSAAQADAARRPDGRAR
jgi:hypothetical protein